MSRMPQTVEIRDPIHGAIEVDLAERVVLDSDYVQRLRGIRQLGFSDLPFPGATHTRYSHSLGAMHVAGRAFDAVVVGTPLASSPARTSLRHCVRLAALCHDLGHPPFSHAAEFAMPPAESLGLGPDLAGLPGRRASHEDYTVAILLQSTLTDTIAQHFPFTARHVAALVSPHVGALDDFFVVEGCDYRDVLGQIVSSDLDADRMDYLLRDSYFTGARYGQIDLHWLISHLRAHVEDAQGGPRARLALDDRAIYAFDDFLIARFHMFVMVYFHPKSICYEQMLQRYMTSPDCAYALPADLVAYLETDDAHLGSHLRASQNPWARRIVQRRPYKVLLEERGEGTRVARAREALDRLSIDHLEAVQPSGLMAPPRPGKPPIHVLGGPDGAVKSLVEASGIFQRYADERHIRRLYVDGVDLARAAQAIGGL